MNNNTQNQEPAVRIRGLKKQYRLGRLSGKTIREDIQIGLAKLRGRENPVRKIGDTRIEGSTIMALNGIDLDIYRGETVGIIGFNGAGKSTLLKLLCRITAPTEGEIELFGRITSMLEVGTGFNAEMTGRENIYQNGAILGMTRKEIDSVIEDIIDFSEVREFIDTPVKRYSSGMYIKLGFAIASHLESEIVIMDEVLAVGDIEFQRKCLEKMRLMAMEDKRTVLYVSHNMHTIRELCDRVIVMNEGKIVYDGEVEKGISTYINVRASDPIFHIDLSGTSSGRKNPEKAMCKLLRLDLEKEDSAVYKSGEPVVFTVCVRAKRDFEELGLFITLTSGGISVATMPYGRLGRLKEGQEQTFRISMDTGLLTAGRYDVSLSLVEKDGADLVSCDTVVRAFSFFIEEDIDFNWRAAVWGHVRMPEAQIEDVSEDN